MSNIFKGEITSDEFLFMTNLSYHKLCPAYIKSLGLTPALLLVDLMSKWTYFKNSERIDKDGYFYNTQENIEKNTCLTPKQQRRAVEILQEKKILKIKLKGSPPKNYFKIDVKQLCLLIIQNSNVTKGNNYQRESSNVTKGNITKGNTNNNIKEKINKINNKSFSKEKDKFSDKAENNFPADSGKDDSVILKRRKSFTEKPIKKIIPKLSSDIQEIFDYWIDCKLRMPRTDSKSYQNCISRVRGLLSGKLFNKQYSVETITNVITSLSFAAFDTQFEPSDLMYKKRLSKITIADFILNTYNKNGNDSLFKNYLKDPPKMLKQFISVEDKYPSVSKLIKKIYQERILGEVKNQFSKSDEECFRLASNKLIEFFNNNQDNLAMNINNADKVNLLFDSILKTNDENKTIITPAWLCSQKTINIRLPSWCFKQSVFVQKGRGYNMYEKPQRNNIEDDEEDVDYSLPE